MKTWFLLKKIGKLPSHDNKNHVIETTAEFFVGRYTFYSTLNWQCCKNIPRKKIGQKMDSSFHQFCKNPDVVRI